jgi:hypothetical protein
MICWSLRPCKPIHVMFDPLSHCIPFHLKLVVYHNEERDYQSGFTTLLSTLPQEQSVVVLCLKIILFSWLLARDGHGEYNGLCGLGRRSITPYVNRRRELYCSSMTLPVCA